jgi:hypothetical protein
MNTQENNKMIAEFMGKEIYQHYHESNYHCSWDWLMPVVEKIDSLGYVFTIQGGKAEYGEMISETRCFIAENKRSSTYNAVVEFINQYNKDESID